jgi:putative ABC transport system permease protein
MRLFAVALKNLRRKRIRTALTIGGVAVAVAVLVSLAGFQEGYQRGLKSDIDRMGYQLLVTAKGCPYEAATLMLKGGAGLRHMEEGVYDKIVGDPRVEKTAPQLVNTVFDAEAQDGRGSVAIYMGVDSSFRDLRPWAAFREGGWFTSDDADEAVMGYEVAELEQRVVGDKIFIPGIDRVLTVAGIFERIGSQDDGVIFVPLETAQRIFGLEGKLTGIGIKLKEIGDIGAFEEDLYDEPGIQVVSMAQVKGTIFNLISSARVMASAIALIAIFVAVIGVVNTILMSVFERTQEIGVMKALGASRLDVFQIIWVETVLICAVGGAAGILLALAGGSAVEHLLRQVLPYAPGGRLVVVTPGLLGASFAGAIALGLVAGVYPALRASSMRPVEAIRRGE